MPRADIDARWPISEIMLLLQNIHEYFFDDRFLDFHAQDMLAFSAPIPAIAFRRKGQCRARTTLCLLEDSHTAFMLTSISPLGGRTAAKARRPRDEGRE